MCNQCHAACNVEIPWAAGAPGRGRRYAPHPPAQRHQQARKGGRAQGGALPCSRKLATHASPGFCRSSHSIGYLHCTNIACLPSIARAYCCRQLRRRPMPPLVRHASTACGGAGSASTAKPASERLSSSARLHRHRAQGFGLNCSALLVMMY